MDKADAANRIPANQQHPRHERTRKSKGSSEEVLQKIRKDGGGGGLLGVRQQEEKVMKRMAGWGPLASREF